MKKTIITGAIVSLLSLSGGQLATVVASANSVTKLSETTKVIKDATSPKTTVKSSAKASSKAVKKVAAAVAAAAEVKQLDLSKANVGTTKFGPTAEAIGRANYGNTYQATTCAAYVFERVTELGMYLPPFLGNADAWSYSGPAQGLAVSKYPQPGSIVVFQPGQYGASAWGHVGVIEEVRPDGSFRISEMTYGVQSYRDFSADDAKVLTFLLPSDYNEKAQVNVNK